MNGSVLKLWLLSAPVCVGLVMLVGCTSKTDPKAESKSGGNDTTEQVAAEVSEKTPSQTLVESNADNSKSTSETKPMVEPQPDFVGDLGLTLPTSSAPQDWIKFLSETNQAMQRLFQSGSPAGEQELRDKLKTISELKQQAAERLIGMNEVPPETLKLAKQAKLEALSQLAGLQSTEAAEALEKYADELALSDDPRLHFNGRVVKLGFLIERLVSGQLKEPKELEDAVTELTRVPELLDMPSAMTLNQVYVTLKQYGYEGSSVRVREKISQALQKNGSPRLVEFAATLAGNVRFDEIGRVLQGVNSGQTVPPSELKAVAGKLAVANPDDVTLNYLNTAALQLEAREKGELADSLYDVIAETLVRDAPVNVSNEAKAIVAARGQRKKAIGEPLEIEGQDLNRVSVDWNHYRGSVVIVPVWSMQSDNFLMLQQVQEETGKYGDKVQALGVNLDNNDAPVLSYISEARIRFPSVRQTDPSKQGMQDPIARQLGVASQPFIVLVDGAGKIAKIVLDPASLASAVEKLVKP